MTSNWRAAAALTAVLSVLGPTAALSDTAIKVTVTDGSGAVGGATVTITDKAGNQVGTGTTAADGTYRSLYIGDNSGQEFTVTVVNGGKTTTATAEPTGGKTRIPVTVEGGSAAAVGNDPFVEKIAQASGFVGGDVSVGRGRISTPRYLGLEFGGLISTVQWVDTDDDSTFNEASVSGGAFLDTKVLGGYAYLYGKASRATAEINQEFAQLDPAGNDLLIPGTGSGVNGAGFNLTGAGNLNGITNARFDRSIDEEMFEAKFGAVFPCECGFVTPFVGVRYGMLESRTRFSGMVPGFSRDFAYDTHVDVDTFGVFTGLRAEARFPKSIDPTGLFGYYVEGHAAADFNDAEGRDMLSFTGFADQSIAIENDDTTFSGDLGAGLTVGNGPFTVSLGAKYKRWGNVPIVSRDGVGPSRLELEEADIFAVNLGIRYSF